MEIDDDTVVSRGHMDATHIPRRTAARLRPLFALLVLSACTDPSQTTAGRRDSALVAAIQPLDAEQRLPERPRSARRTARRIPPDTEPPVVMTALTEWNEALGVAPDTPAPGDLLTARAGGLLRERFPGLLEERRAAPSDIWVVLDARQRVDRVQRTVSWRDTITIARAATVLGLQPSAIRELTVSGAGAAYDERVRMIWVETR